ncbi:hypothetical protein B0H17DRAFT_217932 [Mycena rosella]|uniref:MYND-type domain-containing protein n=1 Tax=Mycena rosella TaxID=1033263 RepID=A0AAD7G958_MYCRO|nr:hypothetical protein B0H17DRAFT_217932 [Mycena rosella]
MECGRILPKSTFRQCSGCMQQYYCAQECQKVDWEEGHRVPCNTLRRCKHSIRGQDASPFNGPSISQRQEEVSATEPSSVHSSMTPTNPASPNFCFNNLCSERLTRIRNFALSMITAASRQISASYHPTPSFRR